MRRTALILSLLVTMASCSNDETLSGNSPVPQVVLNASSETARSHFGTITETSAPVLFDATDEIAVCSSTSTSPSRFTTSAERITDGGASASFVGTVDTTGPFCAVFPYEYVAPSTTSEYICLNVPSSQTYSSGSFGITSNITAATWASGTSFTLKSLFGCMHVAISGNCSVKKVTLEDNNAEFALWGTVSAIPDSSTGSITDISVSNSETGKNMLTITLDTAAALTAETARDFWFVVPEGAFAKGMTMTIYDANDQVIKVISTDKDLTVSRQSLRHMNPVTISDAILFSGGAGTESNPYRIATVEDLKLLAQYVNAGTEGFVTAYYSQTRNIGNADLVDHIGSLGQTKPFSGHYDGNGYTISDITFSSPTAEKGHGLFGYANYAVIENLNINGFTSGITQNYSGPVVGCSTESTVRNCHVSGTMTIKGSQVGGVVGRNSTNSVVDQCSFTGDLTGSSTCVGCIVGLNGSGAKVSKCKAEATLHAVGLSSGGVAGLCESSLADAITECEFDGTIISTNGNLGGILGKKGNRSGGIINCIAKGSISGTSNVGGIVGAVEENSTTATPSVVISGCTNNAEITASAENVGGIAGLVMVKSGCSANIDKCASKADITGKYNVGGIIGYAKNLGDKLQVINTTTVDCRIYATAADPSNHYARVGGIVGGTDKGSTVSINIYNSCAVNIHLQSDDTGVASTKRVMGIAGIVGSMYCAGNIAACYSNVVDADFSVPNGVIYYKGAIAGYCAGTLYASDYYDSACSFGAFYAKNACVGIPATSFTDGTLLANMNAAAPSIEGASEWIAGADGYPVPSGAEVDPEKKGTPIRILAIGNSFSCDAVEQYLWELLAAAGYNATIGDCYIGGCTLQKHWENESSSVATTRNSNSYRKIVGGLKSTMSNKSIEYILRDEPWDYVIFQQGAGLYGIVDSHYPYLTNLLNYVANYLTPGKYKTGYQLNWAFPKSCTNDRFAYYDWDQDKMYAACSDCAKELKTRSGLDVIIPTGTAIQNGRQTTLGDTFNRDWGHLEYTYGRYTAACTWFEQITGLDVRENTYIPATVSAETAALCRQAVHDAVLNPYEVTPLQ